jgi:glutamate-1-semialdehyde 2,1-aminomutase
MTGLKWRGGAQTRLNINADLITYAKVIGGGFTRWCVCGGATMRQTVVPGNAYQAGTLSGNPTAMIAGFTLLNELKK